MTTGSATPISLAIEKSCRLNCVLLSIFICLNDTGWILCFTVDEVKKLEWNNEYLLWHTKSRLMIVHVLVKVWNRKVCLQFTYLLYLPCRQWWSSFFLYKKFAHNICTYFRFPFQGNFKITRQEVSADGISLLYVTKSSKNYIWTFWNVPVDKSVLKRVRLLNEICSQVILKVFTLKKSSS